PHSGNASELKPFGREDAAGGEDDRPACGNPGHEALYGRRGEEPGDVDDVRMAGLSVGEHAEPRREGRGQDAGHVEDGNALPGRPAPWDVETVAAVRIGGHDPSVDAEAQ